MLLIVSGLFFCFSLITSPSSGVDTITMNQSLSGDQTLVSSGGKFELGFFRPGNSSNYYIGIWYTNVSQDSVVWVANRQTPISDIFSSELKIIDGNLVLLNESKTEIWSTDMISTTTSSAFVVLLDDGNLVLRYDSSSNLPVWQSFDHPTHTFLPGSKLGYNKLTNTKQVLTSWKNTEDPAVGPFSLEVDQDEKQYSIKWNGSVVYWTSGSWNGQIFSLVPEMRLNYYYNFSYNDNANESYFTYSLSDPSIITRFIIEVSGQIQQMTWLDSIQLWNLFWAQPRHQCDVYAFCGPFSTCNPNELPFCNCLTAFEPWSHQDQSLGDFSGGCVRKTELDCRFKEPNRGFIVTYIPSPVLENATSISVESECRTSCLNDCTCDAYAFDVKSCWLWYGETLNRVVLMSESDNSSNRRVPLNIKVASSDLSPHDAKINTKKLAAGIISGFVGIVFLCSIGIVYYRRFKRRGTGEENRENAELQVYDGTINVRYLVDPGLLNEDEKRPIDVPFFDFKTILDATENFSFSNKLGQGGFGPVYKGMLPGGVEIAVKRLSNNSGQGLKEFKNEVVLIAKLQHRNLVRLLGYSMKEHEMILVYEYMPNKSLDRFIFDRTLCICLDWAMRFDIILGIARGLLYLHQDSRLRIIHRDLKASNVLLDEDMNPKISDFGLAKIVEGRETEASTKRVIGTYGYMSPEYALDGLFSVKSDVFSFGVVMLEIISGKRNSGYYHNQQAFSLISYAWSLWKDEKPLDLLDSAFVESCNSIEVLRCMIVGLLCIQEDPGDRPTMMNVVMMLGMDVESLPSPKEPAFLSRARPSTPSSDISKSDVNRLTITQEQGR